MNLLDGNCPCCGWPKAADKPCQECARKDADAIRFCGALLMIFGMGLFVWLAACSSPIEGFPPVLWVPIGIFTFGAYLANKAGA